jgi:hypothetical protein
MIRVFTEAGGTPWHVRDASLSAREGATCVSAARVRSGRRTFSLPPR